MDYSLAALKLFGSELRGASHTSSSSAAMTLFGILFQRAWLQGVLVSGCQDERFLLDDGTDVIELVISPELQPQEWKMGMYVMVVGGYAATRSSDLPIIKEPFIQLFPCFCGISMVERAESNVHKIVDLSPYPDREAMWHLEVIEAHKLFYMQSLE